MIPAEAVEAAAKVLASHAYPISLEKPYEATARAALEAAAPYLLAVEQGSAMQEAMRLAWEQGWANARGNYLALHQGQEIPEWVTLRNPYGDKP